MKQIESIDFLKDFDNSIIRNLIKSIENSYNNPWEILSEPLQNATDAIIRKRTEFLSNISPAIKIVLILLSLA